MCIRDSMRAISNLDQKARRFNIIICGSADLSEYNPSDVFQTPIRKGIVIGLHEDYTIEDIAKSLGVLEEEVSNHLKFLKEAEYVTERNGCLIPTFFIALKDDVLRAKDMAKHIGRELAERYESSWSLIEETYRKLSVSHRFSFDRVSFVLVGAYSLDIYMLEEFAREGKIMPKAPRRKAGCFYMWGVEDGMDSLGRYGMHSSEIGEYGYATFGGEMERRRRSPPDHWLGILLKLMCEKSMADALTKFMKLPASEREHIVKAINEITLKVLGEYEKRYYDSGYELNPEAEKYLKEWLYIDEKLTPLAPIYTREDMLMIRDFAKKMSTQIFNVVYKNLDKIEDTFRNCKASRYASFAEFFCWLYHLTFTETIDHLIMKQKLKTPIHGYEYWIWKK